jgi:hypothetical protein
MVRRSRGEDPVYRCPKGGLHKFRKRSRMRVLLGLALGREVTVGVRKCRKCGKVFGAGGTIKT